MMQTYDHAICDGQNAILIKAATSVLNPKNGLMISSSNGPIPEVESANMCHPNGGPRTILEYQFFPECTAICSSSESFWRDGATRNLHVWNLHGGPITIQEYHQFFPEKSGIHSEKNGRVDDH